MTPGPFGLAPFPPFLGLAIAASPGAAGPVAPFGLGPFPPFLGLGPAAVAELPAELVDAVEAAARAALVAPGTLSWFGADLAPPGTPLPYGSYSEPDEADEPWDAAGAEEARGQLAVQLFANGKADARELGNRLRDALYAAAGSGGLEFSGGRLFRFRQSGRSAVQDPDTDVDGDPVWVETRLFEYRYLR